MLDCFFHPKSEAEFYVRDQIITTVVIIATIIVSGILFGWLLYEIL
jgi:hypothetical protein